MIQVTDLLADVEQIFGTKSDRSRVYRHINDAIDVLSNGGDWDPNLVFLDVCCPASRCLALPGWVETVFSVNIDGRPSQGRDRFYEAHLNGPGLNHHAASWQWIDSGRFPTLQDVATPKVLVAHVAIDADAAVAGVRVYGWDENNRRLQTEEVDGTFTDGYALPAVANYAMPPAQTIKPARIERITKADTQGRVRVATLDWQSDGSSGELLADLEGYERFGQYARIKLGKDAKWVRMLVRRKQITVSHPSHWIPLAPRIAMVEMIRALRDYQVGSGGTGMQHEATARRFLAEREKRITPPNTGLPQVSVEGGLTDGIDTLE